ncbi:MAG: ABC transporter ATP-binding protein [Treponema sp.]|jgi:ABC-type dipeptide/oligopeptide/nickel transport system ATPase subunit|nr:ABC transporter ATP-binding protein [Treponema sp.]
MERTMLAGNDLWKTYGAVRALRGVTLRVEPGETVGLVGETGCGKSTLARILCALIPPDGGGVSGEVSLDGRAVHQKPRELKMFRRRVQMVFQDASGSLDPRMTVWKTLAEPLENYAMTTRAGMGERIQTLLETVNLDRGLSRRYPHELSGGQRQRVVIARALAAAPDYLVCDEPLSGLDVDTGEHILRVLMSYGMNPGGNRGLLFISHDLSLCTRVSRRLYVMFAGNLVEHLRAEDIHRAVHPYTRALFEYLFEPEKADGCAKTGMDFGVAPEGCAFRLQCPGAREQCLREPSRAVWVDEAREHWTRCRQRQ